MNFSNPSLSSDLGEDIHQDFSIEDTSTPTMEQEFTNNDTSTILTAPSRMEGDENEQQHDEEDVSMADLSFINIDWEYAVLFCIADISFLVGSMIEALITYLRLSPQTADSYDKDSLAVKRCTLLPGLLWFLAGVLACVTTTALKREVTQQQKTP